MKKLLFGFLLAFALTYVSSNCKVEACVDSALRNASPINSYGVAGLGQRPTVEEGNPVKTVVFQVWRSVPVGRDGIAFFVDKVLQVSPYVGPDYRYTQFRVETVTKQGLYHGMKVVIFPRRSDGKYFFQVTGTDTMLRAQFKRMQNQQYYRTTFMRAGGTVELNFALTHPFIVAKSGGKPKPGCSPSLGGKMKQAIANAKRAPIRRWKQPRTPSMNDLGLGRRPRPRTKG